MEINFGVEFIPEKTSDKFVEVTISYENYVWEGALPLELRYQGFQTTLDELKKISDLYVKQINKVNHPLWLTRHSDDWNNKLSQTYKVFEALLSHEWECRGCGPVPAVNPQPAARIRDIKKKNFVVASKRKTCGKCQSSQMHDILVPIIIPKVSQEDYRKTISKKLKEKIIKTLGSRDCVFDVKRTTTEFVIDHKFPSQRWSQPESDNLLSMSDDEIRSKFQLLTNQTNMLKSRACDNCVFQGKRGAFMGIRWYYKGDSNWSGPKNLEKGCVGCPWYDVDLWRKKLIEAVSEE